MAGRQQRRGRYSRLLHLYLLRVPLLVVELGLQPDHLLGLPGALVRLAALLLPPPLVVVQAVPEPPAVQLDVLVLRLRAPGSQRGERAPAAEASPAPSPRRGPEQAAARWRHPPCGAAGPARMPAALPRPVPSRPAPRRRRPRPVPRPISRPAAPSLAPPPTMVASTRALRPAAAAAAKRAVPPRNCPGWKRSPAALCFLLAGRKPLAFSDGYTPDFARPGRGEEPEREGPERRSSPPGPVSAGREAGREARRNPGPVGGVAVADRKNERPFRRHGCSAGRGRAVAANPGLAVLKRFMRRPGR